MVNEPSVFSVNVPCCHCMIAWGHEGFAAVFHQYHYGYPSVVVRTVRNCSVVRLFVESICRERIGNPGMGRFNKAVINRVIEALFLSVSLCFSKTRCAFPPLLSPDVQE